MLPCSGWWAKAALLAASQASSSWPGTKARSVTPSGRPDVGQLGCCRRGEPHLPQLAHGAVAVPGGQFRRGLVVAVGPGLQAGEAAGVPEFAARAGPPRPGCGSSGGRRPPARPCRPVPRRRRRRPPGPAPCAGSDLSSGAVEGQGQHGVVAGVGGAQRHEGLFGQRRVAVGFLRGGREGPTSLSSCASTAPLMARTGQFSGCAGLMVQGYTVAAPGRRRFGGSGTGTYSRYLIRPSG